MTVRESGRDAVMINCNPETVSTDYDTSDRLYFEPLTAEDVLAVVEVEQPEGVIVQFGGQTPLRLAAGARGGRRAAARHPGRRDRPGRGPRPLRRAARPARASGTRPTATALSRRGGAGDRRARSASRCSCAPPTCSAAARWRSATRPTTSPPTWSAHVEGRPGAPAAARPLPRERDRGRRRRARDGEDVLHRRRSCSTSRRPASTPATRPACSRR